MVGEVYGYGISGGRDYDFGDKKVDFFGQGFHSLINFEFKYDAQNGYESIFTKYDSLLNTSLRGQGTLNYLSSHDDGQPFDAKRERGLEAGTKLLLTPGAAQIYYGDESNRKLTDDQATGDAVLRTFMNWDDKSPGVTSPALPVLEHWQKLGVFKRDHPAVGAGRHKQLGEAPYIFSRSFASGDYSDLVVVGLDLPVGEKSLTLNGLFDDGTQLKDYYSGQLVTVEDGRATVDSDHTIVLLGKELEN
jgi:alpha-amylase